MDILPAPFLSVPLTLISRLAMFVSVAGRTVLRVLGSATSVHVPPVESAITRSAAPRFGRPTSTAVADTSLPAPST